MGYKLYGNVLVLDPGDPLLEQAKDLQLPEVSGDSRVLIDDDAKECRPLTESDLQAYYIDNNIATFQLDGVDWLTLDVDNQYVNINYYSGAQTSILVGSIDMGSGGYVEQFLKRDGIIYPLDNSGRLLLDATNTPNLVNVRRWYLQEAKRVNDERLEIAEIVHAFADNIAHLGHVAH